MKPILNPTLLYERFIKEWGGGWRASSHYYDTIQKTFHVISRRHDDLYSNTWEFDSFEEWYERFKKDLPWTDEEIMLLKLKLSSMKVGDDIGHLVRRITKKEFE